MATVIPIMPAGLSRRELRQAQATVLQALPPLALYIHVPWCVRKCPYCDFNSHNAPATLPEAEFLAALRSDLEQTLPQVWGRQVISVFIGGGTPSLLSAGAVDEMLGMVRAYLKLLPDAEITMEANPGTVEAGRFQAYARSGVNRLSLGVQSFDDACLRALGRIHDGRQARDAIALALDAVPRVNLDLMFALPGQDEAGARRDIDTALSFGTGHLSLYHLTLEPNTVFAKYPPPLPDDDAAAAIQEMLQQRAAEAGYEQYEVSAYARAGQRCQHNTNYWEFGDYLGIGPGAHAKISFHDRILREARTRSPEQWMQRALAGDGSHIASSDVLTPADLPFEFMLNALRLRAGVPSASFSARTGLPLAAIHAQLRRAMNKGLLDADPAVLRATPLGWQFLNDLLEMFLPE
ncbi:radical SAM family heme chaperone HemW [Kerstersia gyiorum]|uniref:Heme chaperone HemW n=1 Tax=Kerstersia gyiorum TaxID=206506 RepID=A0A171KQY1_9BURK|nr:coproporphyrinogen III oxidase [Kerstersia gyiorum]MCP1632669.1 oxygen-independent coproporphyrinogen-3 oxidase [Kerstersia gyiorum]MCP1635800.1 oxygen-independent coproporphyrinogen-3 oxidase [Kerstersia gyiorum]MCP1670791.1 oxygen-independent coproporphyrinogen-3 oxidase [Kerstersia gyiorum]MCP1678554.1 oxygen-independent coproporphyrinogen-3 oxidase [Kerstersia gyiorum]